MARALVTGATVEHQARGYCNTPVRSRIVISLEAVLAHRLGLGRRRRPFGRTGPSGARRDGRRPVHLRRRAPASAGAVDHVERRDRPDSSCDPLMRLDQKLAFEHHPRVLRRPAP